MQDKFGNINQSSSVSHFVLTINDLEIKIDSVLDMEIAWKNFLVTGYIKINDLYDIGNLLNLQSGTIMTLYMDDLYSEYYAREFVITNYNQLNEMSSKLIHIKFQDRLSYTLQNTYVSKGYPGKKLSDIVSDILTTYIDDKIVGFPLTKNLTSSVQVSNRVLVPTISVHDFIVQESKKEGFMFYQSKKGIHFKDIKELIPGKLETIEQVYKESTKNQYYGFNILDFKTINEETSTQNPASKVIAYNPATKSMDSFGKNLTDVYSDVKTGTSGYNPQNTTGSSIKTQEYLTSNNVYMDTYLNFLNSNGIHIVVPGNVKYTDTFKIFDVMLNGNINIQESRNSGDVKLSGKYISTEVVDKIIPGEKFIQKVKLNRVDYTKVS